MLDIFHNSVIIALIDYTLIDSRIRYTPCAIQTTKLLKLGLSVWRCLVVIVETSSWPTVVVGTVQGLCRAEPVSRVSTRA